MTETTVPAPGGPDLNGLAKLRAPLPANLIAKLPGGIPKDSRKSKCEECGGYHGPASYHLDYAGHAAVTDRLLEIDPLWSWEPLGYDERGLPIYETNRQGDPIGMWIKLTVAGVTRLGFGDAVGKKWGETAIKEVIGDAIRNAAMRFGVGLDLWHKGDLDAAHGEAEEEGDGMLDAQQCADGVYEADTLDEIAWVTARYRGGRRLAETIRVADPGTGEMVTLLEFAQACRASIEEFAEPLRARRAKGAVRDQVTAEQDAAAEAGSEPAEPGAIGHRETAAERAARIAAAMGPEGGAGG